MHWPYFQVAHWVFEEIFEGRKLSDLINLTHENKKYLPGIQLPTNIRAIPDLLECVSDADLLIFVIPHQFMINVLNQLEGRIKSGARAISLMKGFLVDQGRPVLFADVITQILKIDCSVLSGANIAAVSVDIL